MAITISKKEQERLASGVLKHCAHECKITHPTNNKPLTEWIPCILTTVRTPADDISTYHVLRTEIDVEHSILIPLDPGNQLNFYKFGSSLTFCVRPKGSTTNESTLVFRSSGAPYILQTHIEYSVKGI